MELRHKSIGTILTPFKQIAAMPIQPSGARGVRSAVEVLAKSARKLKNLRCFSHVVLLHCVHHARERQLDVTPFLDSVARDVFTTRAPCRPDPSRLLVVGLVSIDGATLRAESVDVLDGTPRMDVKPCIGEFDERPSTGVGWLEKAKCQGQPRGSDERSG